MICSFIEIWAKALSNIDFWTRLRKNLSPASYIRLLALAGMPLFLLAILSNLYFLSGNEQIGNEMIKRIFNNSNYFALHFLFALYCGANVSLDYNKVSINLAPLHGMKPERKEGKTKRKS